MKEQDLDAPVIWWLTQDDSVCMILDCESLGGDNWLDVVCSDASMQTLTQMQIKPGQIVTGQYIQRLLLVLHVEHVGMRANVTMLDPDTCNVMSWDMWPEEAQFRLDRLARVL